jgi:hypothetical protein
MTDPCNPVLQTGIVEKAFKLLKEYVSRGEFVANMGRRDADFPVFENGTIDIHPVILDVYNSTAFNFSNQSKLIDNVHAPPQFEICWETSVGQELAKLVLFDMYMVIFSIVIFDFVRDLLGRFSS